MKLIHVIKRKGKLYKLKGTYNYKSEAYRRGFLCNKAQRCKYVVIPFNGIWLLYIHKQ